MRNKLPFQARLARRVRTGGSIAFNVAVSARNWVRKRTSAHYDRNGRRRWMTECADCPRRSPAQCGHKRRSECKRFLACIYPSLDRSSRPLARKLAGRQHCLNDLPDLPSLAIDCIGLFHRNSAGENIGHCSRHRVREVASILLCVACIEPGNRFYCRLPSRRPPIAITAAIKPNLDVANAIAYAAL